MFKVRRALVSVSDKRDLSPFVTGLAGLGIEILSLLIQSSRAPTKQLLFCFKLLVNFQPTFKTHPGICFRIGLQTV